MIGVFDSGVGGLTVVRAIRRALPGARILYVGDVARMPYGNKSARTVTEYAREITRYLIRRGASVIVVACNTASAVAAPTLRREFRVPILDVIAPAARSAKRLGRRIAVLGTRATVGSGAYVRALRGARAISVACPLFVPLVEEGYAETPEGRRIVARTLAPLRGKRLDAAILGCTHYPLLARAIGAALPGVPLVDSSAVSDEVARLSPRSTGKRGSLRLAVTDTTPHFARLARRIIGPARLTVLPVERLTRSR